MGLLRLRFPKIKKNNNPLLASLHLVFWSICLDMAEEEREGEREREGEEEEEEREREMLRMNRMPN